MSEKICPKYIETSNPNLGECKLRKDWLCTRVYAETYYRKCSFLTVDSPKKEEKIRTYGAGWGRGRGGGE